MKATSSRMPATSVFLMLGTTINDQLQC
jgi:hypothetical protein